MEANGVHSTGQRFEPPSAWMHERDSELMDAYREHMRANLP